MARDWKWLAVGNLLLGLMTLYFPSTSSLTTDSIPKELRGTGFSIIMAIPRAFGMVTPYIGGYLMQSMGVVPTMRLLYGISTVSAVFIATLNYFKLVDPVEKVSPGEKTSLVSLVKNSYKDIFGIMRNLSPELKTFTLIGLVFNFFNTMTSSYWVIYLVQEIGVSNLEWGTILLVTSVASVMLYIPAGMFVDKIGAKRIIPALFVLLAIPVAVFPLMTNLSSTMVVLTALTIINNFLIPAARTYLASIVSVEQRGRVTGALGSGMMLVNIRGGGGGGFSGAILTIPVMIGSVLGGYLYSYQPVYLWYLQGISLIVIAILFLIGTKGESMNE